MLRMLLLIAFATLTLACDPVQPSVADEPIKFALPESDDGLPGAGPIRRYDWFRDLWKSRRASFAQEVEAKQGTVVFLGDSITQGWGPDLQGSFPGMLVANRGISGDTTRGMLIRLQEDVLSLKPVAVVMLMGTNDLEERAEPYTIVANVQLILAELAKHNADMPIVLCQVFPSSAAKARPADSIKRLNSLVADIAKGKTQVTVLDTWTLFADADGDARKEEFPDLLHPNAAGYTMWKDALSPVLTTLGLHKEATEDFEPEDGFRSLFNGKDLTGWGFRPTNEQMLKSRAGWQKNDRNAPPWPIVTEPATFDNQVRTPGGRYIAKNNRIVVTIPPEGRKIQQLYTTDDFSGDFVLKLEFRATPNADSGVFLRGPQLQCRDFKLAGPYKDLKHYKPQQWNELVVEATGNVAKCTCNGELLEAEFKVPNSGPIGLEGDRGQVEYRRIRIQTKDAATPAKP